MTLIDFEDARWAGVQGAKLCHTGQNNTFDDSGTTGVKFIVEIGRMRVLEPRNDRYLFFSRVDCNNTVQSYGRLVIQFDTPQQYVRLRYYGDRGQDSRIAFYRNLRATDLLDSRDVATGSAREVVYNSTDPVSEITITTRSPESTLYELEFYPSFADITHDVALALDGSGSMSAQGKWGGMIEAADVFHDLYSEFGDPTAGFGAVRFRWDCPTQLGGDQTTDQPALSPLSTSVDLPNLYATDSPSGCTPIGEGAITAAYEASGGANPSNHVLLLTDGKNNRGRSVSNASDDAALDGVTVHTLGLGTGVHIDPAEITDIATDHGGNFRQTDDPSEVLDFFAESLGDMLGKAELVAISGGTATVAPGTNKAVFLIAWDDPAVDHDFDLKAPDGTVVDHANLPNLQGITVSYHASTAQTAHAYFVVEGDIDGNWEFHNRPGGVESLAVEDLDLRVDWSLTPQFGTTGQPIDLEARVTYRGEPYQGDVTVTADLTHPDEAQGHLLAESLRNDPVSVTPKGDTSQRGRLISTVLERNGREEFRYGSTPGLTFQSTGDGTFGLQFTDTDYDGVYRFDLRAEGKGENGDRLFARRATRFCTLVPAVDGDQTTTEIVAIDDDLYRIDVTPRTPAGDFVGPFLADQLTVQSPQGTVIGELEDTLDGSYTQLVRTDGVEPRDVTIGLQDRTVTVGSPSTGIRDRLPWWLVLLLLALIALVRWYQSR